MPLEIERKYLVNHEKWSALVKPQGHHYRQGYMVTEPEKTIRVRVTDSKCYITIKGETKVATRSEYEYQIPKKDAEELLNHFCDVEVEKTRYKINYKNKLWEVDEFRGENEDLIIAEIELKKEEEIFTIPDWVDNEITGDARYYNARLAQNPYQNWKPKPSKVASSKVPKEILKDIAENMDTGMSCFIHKKTFEVVPVPDGDRFPEMDWDNEDSPWKADIDKVSDNPDYLEIEKMESSDSFQIMENFVLSLPQSPTKIRLITALEGHKPFGNFNHQIHNAGKERDQWFQFKLESQIEWVKDRLEGRL